MKHFALRRCVIHRCVSICVVDCDTVAVLLVALLSLITSHHRVAAEKVPTAVSVTTIINQSPGFLDGNGTAAKFFNPVGMASSTIDNSVYIADSGNHAVRRLNSSGFVTTVVGQGPLNPGYLDGRLGMALLREPTGVAVDDQDKILYIVDQKNHAIRSMDIHGSLILTLAGGMGAGFQDGMGTNARFSSPTAIVLGLLQGSKMLYISDSGNHCIRKMTTGGAVEIIAGDFAVAGNTDGQGTLGHFARPEGMCWYVKTSATYYLYVADSENHNVRYLTFSSNSGVPDVVTLAGNGASGFVNAISTVSQFSSPSGVALIAPGQLGVADTGNNAVRSIDTLTTVTTSYAGTESEGGVAKCVLIDGAAPAATLCGPSALLPSPTNAEGYVLVSDTTNHAIRLVAPKGDFITTVAGQGNSLGGLLNGVAGTTAKIRSPASLWYSTLSQDLFFTDSGNHAIRRLSQAGVVRHVAGSATGVSGYADGAVETTMMSSPYGLVGDESAGALSLYFSDFGNNAIRVVAGDRVSTLAGTVNGGFADGAATMARFLTPAGVTFGQPSSAYSAPTLLYVCDRGNHVIRRVSLVNGTTATICGQPSGAGFSDGWGPNALFNNPTGITFSAFHGGFLVADAQNSVIRLVAPQGSVTTVAGDYRYPGLMDGVGTNALFYSPQGVAVTERGTIYVSDTWNGAIRAISPSGSVTTVCGAFPTATSGFLDGVGTAARLSHPAGVILASLPVVSESHWFRNGVSSVMRYGFVADLRNNALRRFPLSGSGDTETTSESHSQLVTPSGSLSAVPATRSHSATLAGATNSVTGTTSLTASATASSVCSWSRSRSVGTVSTTNRSSLSLQSPTVSTTRTVASRSSLTTSASRPSVSGKRHRGVSASFPSPTASVSATEMCLLFSIGLDASAPAWSTVLQGAANRTSNETDSEGRNTTRTTTIDAVSSLREMTPVSLGLKNTGTSAPPSPVDAGGAIVVSADAIPFSAAILNIQTTPLVFRLRLAAHRQWRVMNASRVVDRAALRVVAKSVQYDGTESGSMTTDPLSHNVLLIPNGEQLTQPPNVSSAVAVGLLGWEIGSAPSSSTTTASASATWLGATVSAYRWTTVGVQLALGCAAGSVTNVILNIPVRPLPVPLSAQVADTGVRALQGLSTLGSTSTVPSLSRVVAVRRMMLCSPDGAAAGGILGLAIERSLLIDAGDATVAGARGAIVGNVIWVLSAGAVLLGLGFWFARCSRRATTAQPRTPLRTAVMVGVLRVALPSSLLPAWLAALPSSAGGAAYLVAWAVSRGLPLDGVDALLVVIGVLWTVIPLTGMSLAQWIVRSVLSLQLRPRSRRQVKNVDVGCAGRGWWWELWRKTSVRTEEWSTPLQRLSSSTSSAAAPEDAEPNRPQPTRRARRSKSARRSATSSFATERSLWVILLEYRVLWFAAYDAVALTVASALSVAASFTTVSVCEGSMIFVLFLFVIELILCWRLRPFTSLRSHVYCVYTLGCTSLSLVFQLVFLANAQPIPTAMWSLQVATALDIVVAATAFFRLVVFDAPQMVSNLRRVVREALQDSTPELSSTNTTGALPFRGLNEDDDDDDYDGRGTPTGPMRHRLSRLSMHAREGEPPLVLPHELLSEDDATYSSSSSSSSNSERRAALAAGHQANRSSGEKGSTPRGSSSAESSGSPVAAFAGARFAVNDSFGFDRMLPDSVTAHPLQDLVLHYRRAEASNLP